MIVCTNAGGLTTDWQQYYRKPPLPMRCMKNNHCCWPLQGVRAASECWVWCSTGRKVQVTGDYPEKGEQRLRERSVRETAGLSIEKQRGGKLMQDVIIILQYEKEP